MPFLQVQVHAARPTLLSIFSREQLYLLKSLKDMMTFGKRLVHYMLKELKVKTRPPGTCRRLLRKTFMKKNNVFYGKTLYFS